MPIVPAMLKLQEEEHATILLLMEDVITHRAGVIVSITITLMAMDMLLAMLSVGS